MRLRWTESRARDDGGACACILCSPTGARLFQQARLMGTDFLCPFCRHQRVMRQTGKGVSVSYLGVLFFFSSIFPQRLTFHQIFSNLAGEAGSSNILDGTPSSPGPLLPVRLMVLGRFFSPPPPPPPPPPFSSRLSKVPARCTAILSSSSDFCIAAFSRSSESQCAWSILRRRTTVKKYRRIPPTSPTAPPLTTIPVMAAAFRVWPLSWLPLAATMPLSGTTCTSAVDGVGTAAITSPDAVAVFTRRAVLVGADCAAGDVESVGDDDDDADAATVAAAVDCVGVAVEEQAAVSAEERADRSAKLHCARKHATERDCVRVAALLVASVSHMEHDGLRVKKFKHYSQHMLARWRRA
ncbi:hypothetical protein F5883DRAFT_173652 [Diaporthe sp. PMI_573]|nr:hypothetical protein F5883DRAFT_173652 [Diaporthaceae sp. PMI_573]